MSGLTTTPEIPRSGRVLIAKLLKGGATGISHVAVGSGVGGPYDPSGVNPRMGNNLEMLGYQPPIIHNDFPVFNFGPNGLVNTFYFMDVDGSGAVNRTKDVGLTFGADDTGRAVLKANRFNHLFLVHVGPSTPAGYGLGTILCADTSDATMPVTVPQVICYIGYVECDFSVKTIYNPTRMFNNIGQTPTVQIEYLGDRAINGVVSFGLLQPDLLDVSTEPNPALMVRARLNLGVNDTIREIAVLGNGGNDVLAWAQDVGTPISIGQGIFIRWALGF